MKQISYVGIRDREGRASVLVEEREGLVVRQTKLDPRRSQKLWNHSPDGFEWGYGGSGPAQLALAILLDALGRGPFVVNSRILEACASMEYKSTAEKLAVRLHQEFKFSRVVGFERDGFRLKLEDVRGFLTHQVGMDFPRADAVQ